MRTLCLALFLASTALAAPAGSTEKARAAYQAAQALYEQGRFADALRNFEMAQALRPHPVTIFNIARCHERLGDVGKALEAYREYLRQLPNAGDRAEVQASIAALEARLPKNNLRTVVVSVEPARAVVKIDGAPLAGTPPTAQLLDGAHVLEVTAEGFEPLRRPFTLSGMPLEMSIALRALSTVADAPRKEPGLLPNDAPPSTSSVVADAVAPRRTGTWVAGGVGVAAAGAATVLGVLAATTASQLRAEEPRAGSLVQADADRAQAFALGANIGWGVAGAAAVTAVVLFFVEGGAAKAP